MTPSLCLRRASSVAALWAVLTVALCTLPKLEQSAHGSEHVILAVIVAQDSSVQDLKLNELRRIFTNADDSGFSGQQNVPFNHPARSTDRVGFDRTVLHMNPDEVGRFWIDRKIRGLAGPPRVLDSLSQLLMLVAHTTGGMSYARVARVGPQVRVVRIAGKLPSDPGYPVAFEE